MGAKRPSVRTLKGSGEKVVHHPSGVQEIVPGRSLAATLASTEDDTRRGAERQSRSRLDSIQAKRDSLSSGDSVPDAQRPV